MTQPALLMMPQAYVAASHYCCCCCGLHVCTQVLPKGVSVEQLALGNNTLLVPRIDYNVSQQGQECIQNSVPHMAPGGC